MKHEPIEIETEPVRASVTVRTTTNADEPLGECSVCHSYREIIGDGCTFSLPVSGDSVTNKMNKWLVVQSELKIEHFKLFWFLRELLLVNVIKYILQLILVKNPCKFYQI